MMALLFYLFVLVPLLCAVGWLLYPYLVVARETLADFGRHQLALMRWRLAIQRTDHVVAGLAGLADRTYRWRVAVSKTPTMAEAFEPLVQAAFIEVLVRARSNTEALTTARTEQAA